MQKKHYRILMPKKVGLPTGRKYILHSNVSNTGYSCNVSPGRYFGLDKETVETNPHLYQEIKR